MGLDPCPTHHEAGSFFWQAQGTRARHPDAFLDRNAGRQTGDHLMQVAEGSELHGCLIRKLAFMKRSSLQATCQHEELDKGAEHGLSSCKPCLPPAPWQKEIKMERWKPRLLGKMNMARPRGVTGRFTDIICIWDSCISICCIHEALGTLPRSVSLSMSVLEFGQRTHL